MIFSTLPNHCEARRNLGGPEWSPRGQGVAMNMTAWLPHDKQSVFARQTRGTRRVSHRATIRHSRTAAVLMVAVATIVGCSSEKSRITPRAVLRGVRVHNFECPPRPTSRTARSAPIPAPQALLLCPLSTPGVRSRAVTVVATQPLFTTWITALSAPDENRTTGACPAYADLPQNVLAKTSAGAYQLSIPTDECGHYQRRALDVLNRARRS